MAAQHRRILEALIQRDWPASRRAISDHIRSQGLVLHMLLERPDRKVKAGAATTPDTP
jgi:DNA-binding GntR family transcriptional regulator